MEMLLIFAAYYITGVAVMIYHWMKSLDLSIGILMRIMLLYWVFWPLLLIEALLESDAIIIRRREP